MIKSPEKESEYSQRLKLYVFEDPAFRLCMKSNNLRALCGGGKRRGGGNCKPQGLITSGEVISVSYYELIKHFTGTNIYSIYNLIKLFFKSASFITEDEKYFLTY